MMYARKAICIALFRPKISATTPEGISKIVFDISFTENKNPICKYENPTSRKNNRMKGSKKRIFFKKP